MVLDYGSLNKKWTGKYHSLAWHGKLLACSVGTIFKGDGVLPCRSPRALYLTKGFKVPVLVVNAFIYFTRSKDSHIFVIMLCILYSESNSSLRTRRPRLLTCVQAPRRLSILFNMLISCANNPGRIDMSGGPSGPNKPYKKPGLAYRPDQAEGVGLAW
jgi:hypothetical protein